MIINRVFCYSPKESKKHITISRTIIKFIISIIVSIFIIIITMNIQTSVEYSFDVKAILAIPAIVVFQLIYWIKYLETWVVGQAYATDIDGYVYRVVSSAEGASSFALGGMAAGKIAKSLSNDKAVGNFLEGASTAVGLSASIYSQNEFEKIMRDPEIIAQMIESQKKAREFTVIRILKIHSYTENSCKISIQCDYETIQTGKIVYNKKINVYKSFNCFSDLKNIILNNYYQ